MKKNTSKATRRGRNAKLGALPIHERRHMLLYGRPNDGGALERTLRDLWIVREMSREPLPDAPPMSFVWVGKERQDSTMHQVLERFASKVKARFSKLCDGCLSSWNPAFFEWVAATMRKIEREHREAHDPLHPPEDVLERQLLLAAGDGVNLRRLAAQIIDRCRRRTEYRKLQIDSKTRNLRRLAKQLGIRAGKPGRPRK